MGRAVDLLQALGVLIDVREGGRVGHPAGRSSRMRARKVAEQTAMRCLRRTDSLTEALGVGADAYEREMSYFSPLTLVREPAEISSPEVEGPNAIAMD